MFQFSFPPYVRSRHILVLRDKDSTLHGASETPFQTACPMSAAPMTSPLAQLHLKSAETHLQRRHMTTMRCYAADVQQRCGLWHEAASRPAAVACGRRRCQSIAAGWNRKTAILAHMCHATASDSAEAAEQTAAQEISTADDGGGGSVAEALDDTAQDEDEEEEEEEEDEEEADDDEDWGTDTFVGLGEEELAAQDAAFRQDMLTNDSLAQDGPDHVTGA
jgi:hypothetical protein